MGKRSIGNNDMLILKCSNTRVLIILYCDIIIFFFLTQKLFILSFFILPLFHFYMMSKIVQLFDGKEMSVVV